MDLELKQELRDQAREFRRRLVTLEHAGYDDQARLLRDCWQKWRWLVCRDDPRLQRELDGVFDHKVRKNGQKPKKEFTVKVSNVDQAHRNARGARLRLSHWQDYTK